MSFNTQHRYLNRFHVWFLTFNILWTCHQKQYCECIRTYTNMSLNTFPWALLRAVNTNMWGLQQPIIGLYSNQSFTKDLHQHTL